MVTRLPGAVWLAAAVALSVLPFLSDWLISYGLPSEMLGFASLSSLVLAALCGLFWLTAARRAGASLLQIILLALVWFLFWTGMQFIGTWVFMTLWNPELPPPFMTQAYAGQQAVFGAATVFAALSLLIFTIFRRGRANG